MLTELQKKTRSRNYIRYRIISAKLTNPQHIYCSLDLVHQGILTKDEYAQLNRINSLQSNLSNEVITFLEKYRVRCDELGIPRPKERKTNATIIKENPPF